MTTAAVSDAGGEPSATRRHRREWRAAVSLAAAQSLAAVLLVAGSVPMVGPVLGTVPEHVARWVAGLRVWWFAAAVSEVARRSSDPGLRRRICRARHR
ncbi:MAG: hypothetical protein ACJ73V_08645, partial [Acidimicrobiia bacterium]